MDKVTREVVQAFLTDHLPRAMGNCNIVQMLHE